MRHLHNQRVGKSMSDICSDIKFLGSANSEAIQRALDKVYQWSLRWDLPLNLSMHKRLVEKKADRTQIRARFFTSRVILPRKQQLPE